MSNAFYRFLNRFIPRSTVKAEPINAQFDAVEDGFDTVEGQLSRAVKITGLTNGGEVAATANTFLMLDASGNPTASATVPFSPTFSGSRLQSVGTGTAGTDAPNLNQVQQLISDAAFGSPELIAMPSLVGNALKQWRVKADETGTEFAFALPQATTSDGDVLATQAGVWAQTPSRPNLLVGGGFTLDTIVPYAWTKASGMQFTDNGAGNGVVLTTSGVSVTGVLATSVQALSPIIAAGTTYTASATFKANSGIAEIRMYVEFYNGATLLSSDFVAISGNAGSGTTKRYSLTKTAPATASSVIVYFRPKGAAAVNPADSMMISRVKFEQNSAATPWNDDATTLLLGGNAARFYVSGISNVTAKIGFPSNGAATTHYLDFDTSATGFSPGFRITAPANTTGVVYGGDLLMSGRRLVAPKVLGFASVYDNGNTSTAQTIDWYNGQKQKSAITANTTITLTAPDSDIVLDGLRWRGTFSGAGGWTVAFTSTATIHWIGNESPTAANGMVTTAGQELEAVFDWDGTRFVGRWTNM